MKELTPSIGKRNFGLDVVRALAILLVLISHSGVRPAFGLDLGFIGVELFFVLSGFLIGQIILGKEPVLAEKQTLLTFYLNRWLRTLPLYFLVLIVKDYLNPDGVHLRYYFFLQSPKDFFFFPVSWSLVVEEWFYLLLPILLLANKKFLKLKTGSYVLCLMTVFILARALVIANNQTIFDVDIRKAWYLRFDVLLTGVFLSYIKLYHPQRYLSGQRSLTLVFGFTSFFIGFVLYHYVVVHERDLQNTFFKAVSQTSMLVFFAVALMFFVWWTEQNSYLNSLRNKVVFRIVTTLSMLAYPVYLVHFDFFRNIPYIQGYSNEWLVSVIINSLLTFATAALLHILVERPIMHKRPAIISKTLFRLRIA